MRDVNKKYKGKYTYVRLSSDIHSGSDIIRLDWDIQSLLNQYPFGYFAISVRVFRVGLGYGFGYRVKCPPLGNYSLCFKIHEVLGWSTTVNKLVFYLKISLKYKLKIIQPITKQSQNKL